MPDTLHEGLVINGAPVVRWLIGRTVRPDWGIMKYLEPTDVLDSRTDSTAARPTATGYGGSIRTNRSLRLRGLDGRTRWYRVYAMVYANSAVPFVRIAGREILASRVI